MAPLSKVVAAALVCSGYSLSIGRRHLKPADDEDYSVKLENVMGVQYHGQFSVGNQSFPVIYDTGSFEVVLLSKHCGGACIAGKTIYDESLSTSFVSGTEMMKVTYASGSAVSRKGFDVVALGSAESPYRVPNMSIWQVVEHEIAVWNRATFSGIVGLAYPKLMPAGFRAPYYPEGHEKVPRDLGNSGNSTSKSDEENEDWTKNAPGDELLLSSMGVNYFAICLERNGPHKPGWLSFGKTPANVAKDPGSVSVPVVGKVHWGIKLNGVSFDGVDLEDPCADGCGAIVDSGTSFLAVPPNAKPLVKYIEDKMAPDCSNLGELPTLLFEVDGATLELPPMTYIVRIAGYCQTAFMDMDSKSQFGPVWIFGMPFLRYYYTVFDRKDLKIHFARSTPTCERELGEEDEEPTNDVHFATVGGGMRMKRSFASSDFQALEAVKEAALPPPPSKGFVF
mmetsp:Transcript_26483/g.57493  ORF Transcript_26483/g.57493 Transcript_26483/m.57493 type:complete len:451 (-) Transcript_26483:324-1676(-)